MHANSLQTQDAIRASLIPSGCLERAQALIAQGGRRILGIIAPPGAGKSTLAHHLQQLLGDQAQVVPMDGFHLANSELQRLGKSHRKGACDTFDAAGYANLLARIRTQSADETIYAPEYRRELEEGVAGAIAIQPSTSLILTEGNYLLLRTDGWARLEGLMDETWYLDLNHDDRKKRLIERHMKFGKSEQDAQNWVEHTDEPNARLIETTRSHADWIVACG